MRNRIVLSIAGPPGAGKTMLGKKLALTVNGILIDSDMEDVQLLARTKNITPSEAIDAIARTLSTTAPIVISALYFSEFHCAKVLLLDKLRNCIRHKPGGYGFLLGRRGMFLAEWWQEPAEYDAIFHSAELAYQILVNAIYRIQNGNGDTNKLKAWLKDESNKNARRET